MQINYTRGFAHSDGQADTCKIAILLMAAILLSGQIVPILPNYSINEFLTLKLVRNEVFHRSLVNVVKWLNIQYTSVSVLLVPI